MMTTDIISQAESVIERLVQRLHEEDFNSETSEDIRTILLYSLDLANEKKLEVLCSTAKTLGASTNDIELGEKWDNETFLTEVQKIKGVLKLLFILINYSGATR
jgi:3-methyladenine DNA glycosylase/8-oxoguanine DNA glycosylase